MPTDSWWAERPDTPASSPAPGGPPTAQVSPFSTESRHVSPGRIAPSARTAGDQSLNPSNWCPRYRSREAPVIVVPLGAVNVQPALVPGGAPFESFSASVVERPPSWSDSPPEPPLRY